MRAQRGGGVFVSESTGPGQMFSGLLLSPSLYNNMAASSQNFRDRIDGIRARRSQMGRETRAETERRECGKRGKRNGWNKGEAEVAESGETERCLC